MPTYYESAGTYHERQRCPRAHATGDRVRRVDSVAEFDACPVCVDEDDEMQLRDVAKLIESGVCPWCDEYEGDHVGRHASSAHPDAWAGYQEARE